MNELGLTIAYLAILAEDGIKHKGSAVVIW